MNQVAFIKTEYFDKDGKLIFSRGEAVPLSYQRVELPSEEIKTNFVRHPFQLESEIFFSEPCLGIVKQEGNHPVLLRLQTHPKLATETARVVKCQIPDGLSLTLSSGQEIFLVIEY